LIWGYVFVMVDHVNADNTIPSEQKPYLIWSDLLSLFSDRPIIVCILWALNVVLTLIATVFGWMSFNGIPSASSSLHFPGAFVLAALCVAACLGKAANPLRLIAAFLTVNMVTLIIIIVTFFTASFPPIVIFYNILPLILFCVLFPLLGFIWAGSKQSLSFRRRFMATILCIGCIVGGHSINQLDGSFYELAYRVNPLPLPKETYDNWTPIDQEAFWQEQPFLMAQQIQGLSKTYSTKPRIFTVAVGAMGSQSLFSREARFASNRLASRFDATGNIMLANGRSDLNKIPAATPNNLAAIMRKLSEKIKPESDIVIVYLTSHGGRDAVLSTNLADYTEVRPISAYGLRKALDDAGIKRRIIIVSSCFAGSWIPKLAGPDTIIIAAAAADRTSFGCDDNRHLTYFGEAFLKGPLAKGASLSQAFDAAKKTVAHWEKLDGVTPSLPQSYVGENMKRVWLMSTNSD
jgi:Peptidase C13 family